jgi:ribosome production factor 2
LHFSGDVFDTHPLYIQFKSLFIDLLHGETVGSVALSGLEHVISITAAPLESTPSTSAQAPVTSVISDTSASGPLPLIHFRSYTVKLLKSGQREPRVELEPMGPWFDFRLRRTQPANEETWKNATRTVKKADPAKNKKNKNVETDEMGDKIGRVHLGRQDLSKLQARKMKGLRRKGDKLEDSDEDGEDGSEGESEEASGGSEVESEDESDEGSARKRKRV